MKRIFLILALLLAAPLWASMSVETGVCTANTGSATTTCTTAFQGKAVKLWSHVNTAEGESGGEARFAYGFSDGTHHWSVGWGGLDASATTNAHKVDDDTSPLHGISNSGTAQFVITGVAFNATPNMVLTFSATPGSAWKIYYELYGGADITNAFVGSNNTAILASTGTRSITAPGFQGDVVFFASSAQAGIEATSPGGINLGMAISNAKQWALSTFLAHNASTSANVNGMSKLRNDECLIGDDGTNADDFILSFTQWTPTGFDLSQTHASWGPLYMGFLVLKGGRWDAGVAAKPATATPQNFSTSFTPKVLGLLMSSPAALNTYTSECTTTVGAYDGTHTSYAGAFHNDAINTVAKSAGASTKVLREINYTAEASGTALGTTSTITWGATGMAYQVAWWAAGDNAAAPGPGIVWHHCTP